ncbi:DUF1707 domain-containing protein [Blastococcus montanus]|uniref:DUF1707 SHOCT-like domain-containing protein n=1 Tax=Blastococcus montanus TaxID=3144973 RepID=UPI003209B6BB
MPEPHLRAADTDRAAVAALLGQAMSEGRLTVAEYDERLAGAYSARTFGELAELTADLPRTSGATTSRSAAPATPRNATHPACAGAWRGPAGAWGGHAGGRQAWGSWASTALIVLVIWAVTSVVAAQFLYFWPFWVIVPWGAMLLMGSLGARGRRDDGQLTG